MPKLERILIAINFSENSKRALQYGRFLADKFGATFDLLHVANPREVRGEDDVARLFRGTPGSTLEVYNEQEIEGRLSAWAREAGLNRRVRNDEIEQGDPGDVIIEVANEKKYDLILMGHHRRASIGDLVSGGVVEKVIRHVRCPVVVCGGSVRLEP
ncbi:MAG TPA: universal stress protein [Myxococcaceae bacterium]|nr:universal stress protein [Myxococcaceae bacterium]